jgi:hypothetical protein
VPKRRTCRQRQGKGNEIHGFGDVGSSLPCNAGHHVNQSKFTAQRDDLKRALFVSSVLSNLVLKET